MPYASKAQARAFHAKEARGEISSATVKEFDKATNFKSLPEKVGKKKKGPDRNSPLRKALEKNY